MMKNMRRGVPNIFKEGVKTLSGVEQAVIRNCIACKSLSDISRTSFGPNGMNKMIINHLGKMFVTSDTGTILKELEVEHPAAKLLVMAAHMQDSEIGDGTNFVVCLGGELLAQAEELIHMGLHTNEIISGYQKAAAKAAEFFQELVEYKVDEKDMFSKDVLTKCVRTAIASKLYGYENLIAPLVAEACLTVMPKNVFNFNVDNVRVVKVLGSNLEQSEVVRGLIIPHNVLTSVDDVKDAKIAVFSCSISVADTETKGTVLIENADQLMQFNQGEEKQIEDAIRKIAESGAKVIVTGGTVDDIAEHFIEKFGLMCLKITSKFELRRLCKAVKARPLVQLSDVTPEDLGYCSHVYVREVGASKLTIFSQDKVDATSVATILLRASTNNILNDIERAIDDGVNVVKAMSRDARFVAGAGASELEVARRLQQFANKTSGLEQYAIQKFAEAFEIFPRTLAENAGLNSMDILSSLYAAHEKGDIKCGIDIDAGEIRNMAEQGVLDLLPAKLSGIRLAMDAITTILRVDQIIQAKPAGGPKMGQKQGHWDDD